MPNYKVKVVEEETFFVTVKADSMEDAVGIAAEDYLLGEIQRPDEDNIEYKAIVGGKQII